ncbi:1,4-dihydroxy-2-naphthoate octaprenyltransferase [Maribacter sp. 1_2014MBL_MicDiv]|uniref:1,4-dihydroxy-2-naphthoate octaprenyltransferase n=1 Tax=Maribacter sp. 1_2014MBL_MicDiv TaxID=1644130 RepID=UPI0008F49CE3|nr:1,4-dihydroxy-2-naphthoate octaprenyltransferase [Maribacter sp. 1_2014MBL_MicDiv]APA65540.1 1,4-dihydroxy-2-naphthoate prenyltransferase [Maribacter sp. 1_2014MBL_MicDiv]
MTKVKAWLNAARLRTLPLSISGIFVGTALAAYYGATNVTIFILALCTTIGLQVTSNFANDYGDGVKGTDGDDRIGPKRALQSGLLTATELKRGIYISIVINAVLIISLIFTSFGTKDVLYPVLFLVLGALAIWAAIKYTVGKSAYGYQGLGDVFVFIFFGLVSVLGSMFLYLKFIDLIAVLPAIAIGLLSVGVLNLNNMRDIKSDTAVGKNTLAVKMGLSKAKKYHYTILVVSFLCLFYFLFTTNASQLRYVSLVGYLPILVHLRKVALTEKAAELDPELKKLALSTFFIAVLFFISYYYFL